MRLKLDENISGALRDFLVERGHECATAIEEGLGGRPDPDVAAVARMEGDATHLDRGFGDLAA